MVQQAWRKEKCDVVKALKNLRDDSIIFNRDVVRNIFRRKKEIETCLKSIQRALENIDYARKKCCRSMKPFSYRRRQIGFSILERNGFVWE